MAASIDDADSFELAVKATMKIYNMEEEESWENMKPYWDNLVLLAKVREKRNIQNLLHLACKFTLREAELLSEWFLSNFEAEITQSKYFIFLFCFATVFLVTQIFVKFLGFFACV